MEAITANREAVTRHGSDTWTKRTAERRTVSRAG